MIQKEIRRQINHTTLKIKEGKKVIEIPTEQIHNQYKIHAIIRFHKKDFELIKKNKKYLTHFNLQYCGHEKGQKYGLVLITRSGYFDGKKERLPVITFKNMVTAKCRGTKENVSYDQLTKKDFKDSLENIKSVPELKKAIYRRYKKSMANLSKDQILSLGVSITKLKLS